MTKLTKEEYLKKAQDYAKSRGGVCLSKEYVSGTTKMEWHCGHSNHSNWFRNYEHIIGRESWCPECIKEKLTKNLESKKEKYLQEAQQYAKSRGGECLETKYISIKTKMKWRCKNPEHEIFESDYEHVVSRNRWCQKCAYDRAIMKDGYEQAMSCAKSRGGLVIMPPNIEIKANTMLTWKCKNLEHKKWNAEFRNVVKLGTWCPYCAGYFSKEEYLQKAKDYAKSKGGMCLSKEYKGQAHYLEFKCAVKSHKVWKSKYGKSVSLNIWCQECRYDSLQPQRDAQLEKAKQHAILKGGVCLSKTYLRSSDKLKWKCDKNHIWEANYSNVVGGLQRWCPSCTGQLSQKEWLEKVNTHAKSRGGKFLGEGELIATNNYLWSCSEKTHAPWNASISNVINNNTWCPECATGNYYKENSMRFILQKLLGFSLKKCHENWNINPDTGKTLELDGYNKKNKFAFEFQGRHHYEEVYEATDLKIVQSRDEIKKQNCEKNGIALLIIKDLSTVRTPKELVLYAIKVLNLNKIYFKEDYNVEKIITSLNAFHRKNHRMEYLRRAQKYAIKQGGSCLSLEYINSVTHLEWKCKNKTHNSWKAGIGIVKRGNWCPECAGKKPK